MDKKTKQPAKKMADDIMMECFKRGLMTLTCGQSAIRLCPPLIVDKAVADQGLDILDTVIGEMEKKHLK
jgi:4-aminobutyrate aminotransferase